MTANDGENGWLIDAHQMYMMCDDLDLDSKDMNRAFRIALSVSSNMIKKDAANRLFAVSYKGGSLKNASFLQNGISVRVWKSGKGSKIGMTSRKDVRVKKTVYKNPAFILRWIQNGTQQRFVLQKHTQWFKRGFPINRGQLEPRPFFSDAVAATQPAAQNALETNISNSLIKIANKKRT